MRIGLIILLFILASCAQTPHRTPAAFHALKLGVVSPAKSLVQLFPSASDDDSFTYYFYLQLKDDKGEFIDCDPAEITLKTKSNKPIPFKYERILPGRYYLILSKSQGLKNIDFFVKDVPLKEKFNLDFSLPDKRYSHLVIKEKSEGKIVFRLKLADKSNRPVSLVNEPEIILEGRGEIENLRHIHEGIWEFTLIYPEDNQIMYFSVRAHGVYLANLLRYQHIEK